MKITRTGGALASAAAGRRVVGEGRAGESADGQHGSRGLAVAPTDTVHCYGVNTCQGTADCATTAHECKGQNSCRGQGFKAMTAKECLTADGTIADLEPAPQA